MQSLYESILKSTNAGEFKFSDANLVSLRTSQSGFETQFNLKKIIKDFGKTPGPGNNTDIIWNALCHLKTGKTYKEVKEILYHRFLWDGPEEEFFKTVFKGYLIEPKKFDFFMSANDDGETVCVCTHEKTRDKRTRLLFDIRL